MKIYNIGNGAPYEIFYITGEELPVDNVPLGSIAINCDNWEMSIFNGTTWNVKG